MTFTRFFLTAAKEVSNGIRTGYRSAVAVCITGLLGAVPPATCQTPSSPPLALELSFNIGRVHSDIHITKPIDASSTRIQPVTTSPGGSAVVFQSTLLVHARNDTLNPPFDAHLVATAQAADPDTLVGGILPAAIRVEQDLAAGMTFQQAVADAQTKTQVTVTHIEDPTAIEYAVMLALIIVVVLPRLVNTNVAPPVNDQLAAVQNKMAAALAGIGISVPTCSTSGTTIP